MIKKERMFKHKNMKNKKTLGIILAIIITLVLILAFYFVFNNNQTIKSDWHDLFGYIA